MPSTPGAGEASLRLPDTVLLGLAKAGTTTLFNCLMSDVFTAVPRERRPCCTAPKEPGLFMSNLPRTPQQRTAAVSKLAHLASRWHWPTVHEPNRRLLEYEE